MREEKCYKAKRRGQERKEKNVMFRMVMIFVALSFNQHSGEYMKKFFLVREMLRVNVLYWDIDD